MLSIRPTAISYTPFNNDTSNWCRTASQVKQDLKDLKSKGISQIRIYGTDCDSLRTVLPVAASLGLDVVQGFYISEAGASSVDSSVTDFINYVQGGGDISAISSITIGNEAVTNGWITAKDLVNKIQSIRAKVQAVGFRGYISTAEIPGTFAAHPELCSSENVQYVAVNAHPYFDPFTSADQAGSFILEQVNIVKQACPGMYVRVVETGYPHDGNVNGKQIPSVENQITAVTQIYNALGGDCILFSMWDDHWKNPGSYNVEWYFGIYYRLPNA